MIERAMDVLQCNVKPIYTSIFLAFISAIVSFLRVDSRGSRANDTALAASHWLIVIFLSLTHVAPELLEKTDVELVWVTYGFLFGELDQENIVSYVLVICSAFFFHLHRRKVKTSNETAQQNEEQFDANPIHA